MREPRGVELYDVLLREEIGREIKYVGKHSIKGKID